MDYCGGGPLLPRATWNGFRSSTKPPRISLVPLVLSRSPWSAFFGSLCTTTTATTTATSFPRPGERGGRRRKIRGCERIPGQRRCKSGGRMMLRRLLACLSRARRGISVIWSWGGPTDPEDVGFSSCQIMVYGYVVFNPQVTMTSLACLLNRQRGSLQRILATIDRRFARK